MNLERLEGTARLVCEALGARLIEVVELPSDIGVSMARIRFMFPANAEPDAFMLEFVNEHEMDMMSEAQLAGRLFCALWLRCQWSGLNAIAQALGHARGRISGCE